MKATRAGVAAGILATIAVLCARAAEETVRYWYDAAGRLTAAGYSTQVTNTAAIRYAYDPNGNRTNLVVYGRGDATDADGDSLRDGDEIAFFGDLDETGDGDSDGDALDNAAEMAFGSDPTKRNTDGDPAGDREEWIADTHPGDPTSYFHITAVSNAPRAEVHFESSAARLYTLYWSASLLSGVWSNAPGQGPRTGVGGADFMIDTNAAASNRFYRLDVRLP